MSVAGQDIVHAARRWIGTPYHHQAATRGAGCDCLGLVRGLWREFVGAEPFEVPAYTPDWAEADRIELLWQTARDVLAEKPVSDAVAGDIVLFRMRAGAVAKHLGVLSQTGTAPRFIHAYQGHGVVESPLSAPWSRRIVGCFALPL